MATKRRIIPTLLLENGGLVKTIKYKNAKYIGDPINTLRIFNDKEVDEIIILDISASKQHIDPNYSLIERFAGECFMPLTYGGGVKSVAQAKTIFSLGVEKISIHSAAFDDIKFISDLVYNFGSQSIVVSLDIKKNWLGGRSILNSALGETVNGSWLERLKNLEAAGCGEVLLSSVDRDGTLMGADLELIQEASSTIKVPLIALGGISSLKDIKDSFLAGASAVAAGSFFVFYGPHRAVLITYPDSAEIDMALKELL